MNETIKQLEALLEQLLELAKDNPDLLFKIIPNETRMNWTVAFTKFDLWWQVVADSDDESLIDVINDALVYFESLTDEMIKNRPHWTDKEKKG